MTSLTPYHCPIVPVQELHGRTPKTLMAATIASNEAARPGDVVALRQSGCMLDCSPFIGATLHVVKTASGFRADRLCELSAHSKPRHAQCMAAIDDDWEIFQEFPCEFLEPGEVGPVRFNLIHSPDVLMLIWLEEFHAFDRPPALLTSTLQPAALFIAEDDLSRSAPSRQRKIRAQIDLCEHLSGVPILRSMPT